MIRLSRKSEATCTPLGQMEPAVKDIISQVSKSHNCSSRRSLVKASFGSLVNGLADTVSQIIKKFGNRVHARHKKPIAGSSAGNIEEMPLGLVHFLEIRVIGY